MIKELNGKTALVTGGSRNIGRATALALADKGADVVITYAKQAYLAKRTVSDLESKGVRAACIQVNLTAPANCFERLALRISRAELRPAEAEGENQVSSVSDI